MRQHPYSTCLAPSATNSLTLLFTRPLCIGDSNQLHPHGCECKVGSCLGQLEHVPLSQALTPQPFSSPNLISPPCMQAFTPKSQPDMAVMKSWPLPGCGFGFHQPIEVVDVVVHRSVLLC